MNQATKNIILDFERMKYPNTGLFHFCKGLGEALVKELDPNKETLHFYLPKSMHGIFGTSVQYIHQQSIHKLVMPSFKNFACWHATNQTSEYYPANKKIPVVLTVHDLNFLYDSNKSEKRKKIYQQNLQAKVDRANLLVAISSFTAKELMEHVDIGNKKIEVIYNGCGIDESIKETAPNEIPQSPFLFTIGTIAPKKNFHELLKLLIGTNYQLVIAGITQDENYKQFILTEALRLDVAKQLIFTGAISESEKYWFYQHCTAFLFPSLAEGFGLPVIEAMHFGKTVLLSTVGPLPEIGGSVAHYFNDFTMESMQMALSNALAHDELIKKRADIQAHAKQFSWQKAANAYLQLYRSIS
jgi:glycosyltransferase involved in cell wall biosynthesis